MLDLVRQRSVVCTSRFNDMTDFDIDVAPGVVWDDINTFNADHMEGKMKIEKTDNKHIIITLPEEEGSQELVVKVTFFTLPDLEDTGSQKTRVKFIKKRGDLTKWYSMFQEMKDAVLSDILIAPEQPSLIEE